MSASWIAFSSHLIACSSHNQCFCLTVLDGDFHNWDLYVYVYGGSTQGMKRARVASVEAERFDGNDEDGVRVRIWSTGFFRHTCFAGGLVPVVMKAEVEALELRGVTTTG